MKALTLARARGLIKRELGLSAASLTAPLDMNGNRSYPWYEMFAGTQRIEVNTNDVAQGKFTDKMVCLSIIHENSSNSTSEYFYGDTLEYATAYTDWKNREVFCERMEDPQNDAMLHRLKREALDDCWGHFHIKKASAQIGFEAGTMLLVENNHAVFDRYNGFFMENPTFRKLAQYYAHGKIPEKGSFLKYIGNGTLVEYGKPVYVLQDPKNGQVYLYDAGCKNGLRTVSADSCPIASPSDKIKQPNLDNRPAPLGEMRYFPEVMDHYEQLLQRISNDCSINKIDVDLVQSAIKECKWLINDLKSRNSYDDPSADAAVKDLLEVKPYELKWLESLVGSGKQTHSPTQGSPEALDQEPQDCLDDQDFEEGPEMEM